MRATAVLLLSLFLTGILNAQERTPATRLYAAIGLGFVNLEERGLGLDVPLGFHLILVRYRLVAAVQALDLALLQKQDQVGARFVRAFTSYGEPACFDTQTGYLVSSFRCGGDTKALFSLGADLSFTPVETSFFGGKPGKLAVGVGYRGLKPRTVYGTLGLLFNEANGAGGGIRVALGRRYVYLGAHWAFLPKRLLGRR
ncbi:MAG: hypothetical protein HYW07_09475 [Candidatus Latescibacteria bacterium]|nr:hypothetical protein [Candidatus Latescibacterota bacterium]